MKGGLLLPESADDWCGRVDAGTMAGCAIEARFDVVHLMQKGLISRTVVGQDCLGTLAVAVVGCLTGLGRAGRITQVMRHFRAQNAEMIAFLNLRITASSASAVIGPVTNWSLI